MSLSDKPVEEEYKSGSCFDPGGTRLVGAESDRFVNV